MVTKKRQSGDSWRFLFSFKFNWCDCCFDIFNFIIHSFNLDNEALDNVLESLNLFLEALNFRLHIFFNLIGFTYARVNEKVGYILAELWAQLRWLNNCFWSRIREVLNDFVVVFGYQSQVNFLKILEFIEFVFHHCSIRDSLD